MYNGHTNPSERSAENIFGSAITTGVGEKNEYINPEASTSLNSEVSEASNRRMGSEALRYNEVEPTNEQIGNANSAEILPFEPTANLTPNIPDRSVFVGVGKDKTVGKHALRTISNLIKEVFRGDLTPADFVEALNEARNAFLKQNYGIDSAWETPKEKKADHDTTTKITDYFASKGKAA